MNQVSELKLLCQCLKSIVRPGDPVALLAVLRSELFGVSDQTLYAFKRAGGRFSFNAKLPEELSDQDTALEGNGLVAITSHYDPLTLQVSAQDPVITDPNATIAWSGNLQPEFRTDISLKTFFGRGSGESVQMQFQGDGFVVVQPFEEVTFQAGS